MAVEAPEGFCLPLPQPLPMCGLQDWFLVNGSNNSINLGSGFDQLADHQHHHFPSANFQEQNQAVINNNNSNINNPLLIQQRNIDHQYPSRDQGLVFDWDRAASSFSSSSCSSDSHNMIPTSLSQSLEAHLRMQSHEVARFLDFQSERLRRALQEQREHQLSILVKEMESKAMSLARQKEEDLAIAKKKALELEACVNQAQIERDSWELVSREKDAMVIHLTHALEQARDGLETASSSNNNLVGQMVEEEEEEYCQIRRKMACKSCNSRVSSVVFLPCRHLCSCLSCEALLVTCPVCDSVKQSSMEVFLV